MKIKKMQQLMTKVTNAKARDRVNSIENACFQIRKQAKLSRSRSQLYQKLWCRAKAHFSQNFTFYAQKQPPRCETNEKQHFSGDSKPTRGARYQSIPRPPPLKSRVERSTSTQCLRDCTRGLQPSLRPSIGADPLQNLHIWSNTRPNVHFQSWTESVLVSLSYEQYHFQVRQTTSKNRIFASGSFSAVSTNFSILSSLSGRIHSHLGPEAQNFRSID